MSRFGARKLIKTTTKHGFVKYQAVFLSYYSPKIAVLRLNTEGFSPFFTGYLSIPDPERKRKCKHVITYHVPNRKPLIFLFERMFYAKCKDLGLVADLTRNFDKSLKKLEFYRIKRQPARKKYVIAHGLGVSGFNAQLKARIDALMIQRE